MTISANSFDFLASAKQTLYLESSALTALMNRLDHTFVEVCQLILACQGRVVVTGIGKSGHIGRKIAATLASTGTPAFFLHAAEASHGDLGMLGADDLLLVLSYSGETVEILTILNFVKRRGIPVIALCGQANSTLIRYSELWLDLSVAQEACPLNLAPTASTTSMLALGDALAIALLQARGFRAEDFALFHPGGNLGKHLLTTVSQIMKRDDQLPQVKQGTSLRDTLFEITAKGLGFCCVVDEAQYLCGILTDGDLRRALDKQLNLQQSSLETLMSKTPISVTPQTLAAKALHIMQQRHITALPVVDSQNHLCGALKLQDLLDWA